MEFIYESLAKLVVFNLSVLPIVVVGYYIYNNHKGDRNDTDRSSE